MIILSIDPGLSSGLALGERSETEPYRLVKTWQFSGGVAGMLQWLDENHDLQWDDWVCERFTPISHANYSLTLASVEPLAVEGALMARGVIDRNDTKRMRRPQEMYIFGGDTLPEKKKKAYAWLKANGMYVTGKTVGQPNADDARSAIMHGISYLVRVEKHEPTWRLLTGTVD